MYIISLYQSFQNQKQEIRCHEQLAPNLIEGL